MKPYAEMTKEELIALRKELKAQYREMQGKDLKLDMSRGKPSVEQLDLSMGMMDVLSSNDDLTCEDGTDCRNYGVLTGIDEAKELLVRKSPDLVFVGLQGHIFPSGFPSGRLQSLRDYFVMEANGKNVDELFDLFRRIQYFSKEYIRGLLGKHTM